MDSDEDQREEEEADFLQDFIFNEENPWRRTALRLAAPVLDTLAQNLGYVKNRGLVVRDYERGDEKDPDKLVMLTGAKVDEERVPKAKVKVKTKTWKLEERKPKRKGAKQRKAKLIEKKEPNPIEGTIIDLAKSVLIEATRKRAMRWSDEDTDYEKDQTKFPEGLRIREQDKEKGEEEHLTELHKKAAVKWAPESSEGRRFRHVRQELRNILRQEDMTDEFNRDFNVSV